MDEGRIVTRRKIKDKPEGTLLAGRYDVQRVVGKGGFSIVYEAVDTQNGSRVAVKECTEPSGTERFLREAGMLRPYSFSHPLDSSFSFSSSRDIFLTKPSPIIRYLRGIEEIDFWSPEKMISITD